MPYNTYMNQSEPNHKLESLYLGKTTRLRLSVWHLRRHLRTLFKGKDVLDVDASGKKAGKAVRIAYRTIDSFMERYFPATVGPTPRSVALHRLKDMIDELGYDIVEVNENKPWGAYFRLKNDDAERFIKEFFPGLSVHEAKLGNDSVELSPKFLLVLPGQRLSWQYHDRRAERWRFLSKGAYIRSSNDVQQKPVRVEAGTVVQFGDSERHRLCALDDGTFCLVAEIWQHVDPSRLSDEDDIVRLDDDYQR
jgi:mannose-6-phosphate isomerase